MIPNISLLSLFSSPFYSLLPCYTLLLFVKKCRLISGRDNQILVGSVPDSINESLKNLGVNPEDIQYRKVIYNPQNGQCWITFQSGSKPIEMSGKNEPIYVGLNPKYNPTPSPSFKNLQDTKVVGPGHKFTQVNRNLISA